MSKIYFGDVNDIKEVLSSTFYTQLFVLVDDETEKYCYPILQPCLTAHKLISVKNGELHKTLETCDFIWQKLTENEADRNALLINLGGGVITDMGGFCAGTFKRGINFINIPTTLLAQVDASVGGKTGVDFNGYKNHIGIFTEPIAVIIDTVFHKTLENKQLASGYAEMLKHGLIADKAHWIQLVENGYEDINISLIKHSISIKEKIVNSDPQEKGLRKILNFGHTVGHAIESYALARKIPLLHGEAVGIGMIAEIYISFVKGYINKEQLKEIEVLLRSIYKIPDIKKDSFSEIMSLCKQDKKNQNGTLNMSLLEQPGQANFNIAVDDELLENALSYTLS
jgi:3-dehydroquinate synthase